MYVYSIRIIKQLCSRISRISTVSFLPRTHAPPKLENSIAIYRAADRRSDLPASATVEAGGRWQPRQDAKSQTTPRPGRREVRTYPGRWTHVQMHASGKS